MTYIRAPYLAKPEFVATRITKNGITTKLNLTGRYFSDNVIRAFTRILKPLG